MSTQLIHGSSILHVYCKTFNVEDGLGNLRSSLLLFLSPRCDYYHNFSVYYVCTLLFLFSTYVNLFYRILYFIMLSNYISLSAIFLFDPMLGSGLLLQRLISSFKVLYFVFHRSTYSSDIFFATFVGNHNFLS